MKCFIFISFLLSFVTFSQSDSIKAKVDTSLIYDVVDVVAEFPGGVSEMGNFVSSNFEYTDSARINNEMNKIFVEFVINKDGTLADVKIVKSQKYME
jgi:protein TonB